MIWLMGLVL